jgi:hypothetical protein
MSDHGDLDRDDDDDESHVRSSREIQSSPTEDSGGSSPNRCKFRIINWARRSTCNMCNMPKFQKAEARTGI